MTPYEIYQHALAVVSVAALVALLAVLVTVKIWPYLTAAWDGLGGKGARCVFLAACALACLYGGAKHNYGRVTYPRTDPETWYLLDNGSYVTNDAIHVAFHSNPILPGDANIFIEGLELSYTNQDDWAEHSFLAYSNVLSSAVSPFDVPFPAATNYNWLVYTDWTPGPTVHTNGIAYASWQRSINGSTNELATLKTGIYIDTLRISPSPALTNSPPSTSRSAPQQEAP